MVVLDIVAVVTFITMTSAATIEYSEEILQNIGLTEPGAAVATASTINADYTRALDRSIVEEPSTANLVSVLLPVYSLRGHHPMCKSFLGIKINGQHSFCGLNLIKVIGYELERDRHYLILRLYFTMRTAKPFILDVPIFKRPPMYEAAGQEEQFKEWAAEKRVATTSPMSTRQLIDLNEDLLVPVKFTWLNEVFSMEITKRPIQVVKFRGVLKEIEYFYATRPLVLSEDITTKFLDLAYWRNREEADLLSVLPSTSIQPR